ncbi:MAG: tetratricopeptide repeat protein [Gammaproteobacteria bacterium]|nr:tetratricopeptide repeat protein [Gammaproteobacteria bacterium]
MSCFPLASGGIAFLAGVWLTGCASGQLWLNEAGWPPFPQSQARAMLAEASGRSDAFEAASELSRAAEFAYRRDLYPIASEAAELWLEQSPDDLEALALAAALAVALDQPGRSIAVARRGLARPEKAERFVALFVDRLSGLNPELLSARPLEPVTAALAREFPGSSGLLALAARVALGAERYDEVLHHANVLLRRNPGDDAAHVIAATAQLRGGDPDMALARLTEQMALRESVSLEQNYAMLLLENRQPREAVSRMRELRRRHPDLPELTLAEARMLRLLGAVNLAEPILLELFARGWEVDQVRKELGGIAADRGEWLEAVEWYAGIRSETLALAAAQGLVRAFVELEEFDEALAAVLHLVRGYPRHTYEGLSLAGSVMQSAGRPREALAAYEEGLRYVPDSRQLRMASAHMLVALERHRRAIQAMEELLEDFPRDSEVLNALGYTLADLGIRLEEAHGHIRLALELSPDAPAIVDSMGWVLYRLGRPEEALPLLEQALAAFPHPEVAAHLCEVLFELGQTERAGELLRESLKRFEDTALLEAVQERYSR